MPEFDPTTLEKLEDLRAIYDLGRGKIEVFEMVRIDWPEPTGTIWYANMQTDEIADPPPPVEPVVVRLMLEKGAPFLPIEMNSSIGDDDVDLEFWDPDEGFSRLLNLHGEGVKATPYWWFPQVELLLEAWHGHLELGEEETIESIKVKAAQGFRSSDANVPGRGHYHHCSAIFGGLLDTQAAIDELNQCDFNLQLGGDVGTNDPETGEPWTFCDRLGTESCILRGVNPLRHLSHRTVATTILNNQPGGGAALLITTQGNETNLKEPVRVVMGRRRVYGCQILSFSVPTIDEDGWYFGIYEVCEGPIRSISSAVFNVGDRTQSAIALHYNFRLGLPDQTPVGEDLTPSNFSSTAIMRYNFGYVDTRNGLDAGSASAHAMVEGLDNIRVYSDVETYVKQWTDNRAWHLMEILTNKRWGYGLDHDRLDIQSFIDAAAWCEERVTFTDPFGTEWTHTRSLSNVELIGKKVQQQIEDICMAGRLSLPFLFNGKITIIPLRTLTDEELAAAPVFTDEGDTRNIIWNDGQTSLKIGKRKSVKDLVNRIECTFDDRAYGYSQQPLRPVEDVPAQLKAGRLLGDFSKKINPKQYALLGVTEEAQAVKLAWSLLDLGPHDEGGLQNNLPINFEIWFADALDLHLDKVIRVRSSRLEKYKNLQGNSFEWFRVKKISRKDDLCYELECQAYNKDYMDAFEGGVTVLPPPDPPENLEGDEDQLLLEDDGSTILTTD